MENTTAIILVAGFGSRLRPLTDNSPKSLLPLGNTTTLDRMIGRLVSRGITDFVFVTGYMSDHLQDYIRKNYGHDRRLSLQFVENELYETTNTGYSLLKTRSLVEGKNFIKIDGDLSLEDEILDRLVAADASKNYLCVDKTTVEDEVIKVSLSADGAVTAIGKYVPLQDAVGESIGIERISAGSTAILFDTLETMMSDEKNHQEYYEFAYDHLVQSGLAQFELIDVSGLQWVEMDTPEDYALAQKYFAD